MNKVYRCNMLDWIWVIVRVVTEIVRMGCNFLGWSTVWLRNAIKERELRGSNSQFRTPVHLGVTFSEQHLITLEVLSKFIDLCVLAGVRRVTLYDPWNECIRLQKPLRKLADDRVEYLNHEPFPDLKTVGTAVQLLCAESGRTMILDSVKQLMKRASPVSAADVDGCLNEKGVLEPDMLLKVGRVPTMAGYPPLALRVTEIVCVGGLPTTKSEFHSTLLDFSRRDIRLGR